MVKFTMYTTEKGTVGFPRTPCVWKGRPKYRTITKVRLTCGGGMGGASWYEYLEQAEIQPGLNKYVRVDGSEITINGNFVVYAEDLLMMEVKFLPSNPHFDDGKTVHTRYMLVPHNKMRLVDEYKEWEKA